MSRPVIGVTVSEIRSRQRVQPARHADPTQTEMTLGLSYMRAVEMAGGLPVGAAGYLPGFLAAAILFPVVRRLAMLPIALSFGVSGLVLVLTLIMCAASGWLALRKLHVADPADLF